MSEFINPYTFVALPKGGAARSNPADCKDPVFSGEIKCTLVTKTQIAVPDVLKNPNAPDDAPKEYDFFNVNGTAAIPGSGLRGVIRSVFETLTDSCMRLNDSDEDYFHTRLNKTNCGILEFDGQNYVLFEAERLRDKEDRGFCDEDYYTGKVIKNIGALPGDGNASRIVDWSGGSLSGVYLLVNPFGTEGRTSHPSVFRKKSNDGIILKKVYIDRFVENIKMYEGLYHEEYEYAFDDMIEKRGQLPVWYWQDPQTGHYYFAPSQNSRSVFVNQPKDFVKNARIERCTSGEICEACALFGFIGDESRASRVRFTDALCQTPEPFDKAYLLPILATPRLSSFEFYLDGNGSHKFGADTEGVTMRGRKFYWHQPDKKITRDDEFAGDHSKMACRMQLVKSGCEFKFSVFFDKITDDQLKKLVFALNLGNNDSPHCHKIGHGKPIGLGSVKIKVDEISKRSFKDGEYSVEDVTKRIIDEAKQNLFRESKELTAFLDRVLNFESTKGSVVDYPRPADGGDIFKWFQNNREGLRDRGYIGVKQLLPKITDPVQTLEKNEKSRGKNNSGGGRR